MFTAGDLRAFGFTDELVDRIMRFLSVSADDLAGSKPDAVVPTAFGGAPASVACSTHAGKAQQHVVDAITDMVTGLHGYHTSLVGMKRNAHHADHGSETDIRRILGRAEDCAAAPTVRSPGRCTPSSGADA